MNPVPRNATVLAKGFSFLESPHWYDDKLYVSDFYQHCVYTVSENGETEALCKVPGQPSGLGFTPDRELLIVSMLDRRLLRLEDDSVVTVADLSSFTPFPCNDMVVDEVGRAYVGNFGWDMTVTDVVRPTVLLLVDTNGRVSVAADELVFPNGSVLTPDGRTLIVAETFANRISAFEVARDGSLGKRRIWASFSQQGFPTVSQAIAARNVLPDGIALDAEGAIWISDAIGHGATRIAEGGKVLDFVDTGEYAVYAIGLGGSDLKTLYMCVAPPLPNSPVGKRESHILSCRVDVPRAGR